MRRRRNVYEGEALLAHSARKFRQGSNGDISLDESKQDREPRSRASSFGNASDVVELSEQSLAVGAELAALAPSHDGAPRISLRGRKLDATAAERALVSFPGFDVGVRIDLSKNALVTVPPLPATLCVLSLRSNALTSLAPLSALRALAWADVGHNRLRSLEGLGGSADTLRVVCAPHNLLQRVHGLEPLLQLRALDLRHNQLARALSLRALSCNARLADLWVEGNPIPDPEARAAALDRLPRLRALDGRAVGGVYRTTKWTYAALHSTRTGNRAGSERALAESAQAPASSLEQLRWERALRAPHAQLGEAAFDAGGVSAAQALVSSLRMERGDSARPLGVVRDLSPGAGQREGEEEEEEEMDDDVGSEEADEERGADAEAQIRALIERRKASLNALTQRLGAIGRRP